MNNNYIEFINLEEYIDKNILKKKFIFDLEEYSNKDKVSNILKAILTEDKYKNRIRIKFFFKKINEEICYLIIISGSNDNTLLQLGEAYNFPRGFPIIWVPNKILNMYGFYPKFENDKNKEESLNTKIFENSVQMNFNFKYSGFLGQVISFEINNLRYWTTCSKNSTNNIYSKIVFELIKSNMTAELLDKMCDNNIHFCGETMSKYDQVHGAEVSDEALVITLVSKGHWIKNLKIDNDIIIKGSNDTFIEPLNQEDMYLFCIKNNLNVDNIYKIKYYDSIFKFMTGLNNIRNFISLNNFNEYLDNFILSDSDNFKIKNGNILHKNFLGNILEGLIIKIIKNDGNNIIIKYKFPFYTSRTFLLRTYLNDCITNKIENNEEDKDNFFTQEYINIWRDKYKKYINNWVINDNLNGKIFWENIFEELFKNYNKLNKLYKDYILLQKDTSKLISKHIFLMDTLFKILINKNDVDMPNITNFNINLNSLNKESNFKEVINIIFILGPVGTGKSSIGRLIELTNPELFKHIDGDLLDLNNIDLVMRMSNERNDYTKYKVIEQIINKKIPILSAGGGVLFTGFGKEQIFNFINNLYDILDNIDIKVTIFLPNINEENTFTPILQDDIEKLYKDCKYYSIKTNIDKDEILKNNIILKSIKNIYNNRLLFNSTSQQRGYDSELSDKIFKKTKENFNLVINIIKSIPFKDINKIILFPMFNKETYKNKINNNLLIDSIKPIFLNINYNNLTSIPKFQQKRLLTSYKYNENIIFGHLTIDYKINRTIIFNDSLNNIQNKNFEGFLYTCYLKDDIDIINMIIFNAKELLESDIKLSQIKNISEYNKKTELKNFIDSIERILYNYNEIENIDLKELIRLNSKYIVRFNKTLIFPKFDKKCSLIIFPNSEIFENNNIGNYAHITVNPGNHKPHKMKFVAENIYSFLRNNTIPSINNLETLNKKKVSYLFNEGILVNVRFNH
jgi:shikimate kinase